MGDDQVGIAIGLTDEQDADELRQWLYEAGATDIEVHEQMGILPLVPIIIGAVIGVTALVDLLLRIRDRKQYEQIITYHDGKAHVQIVEEIRNGKIIVIADKDTVVEMNEVPDGLNVTDIAKTAITEGAEAAKAAIEAAGGKAEVTKPADAQTKDAAAKVA